MDPSEARYRAMVEVSSAGQLRGACRAFQGALQEAWPGLAAGEVDVPALARLRDASRVFEQVAGDVLGEASLFRPEVRAEAAFRVPAIF